MMKCKLSFLTVALALPFMAARGAAAHFTLGIPGAPEMRATSSASDNVWLASNNVYAAMGVVAPGSEHAVSAVTVAGAPQVELAAVEAAFALERTKPEYFLGDKIVPPDGVDWPATYTRFLADAPRGFLFDPAGEAVYVTEGGTLSFTWVLANGDVITRPYITAPACMNRPRRIYWTDHPYNAPGINLSGKFVKFFGSPEILTPRYGVYTNAAAGIEQVVSNRVVSGLVLDQTTKILNAYGELQGQVVMAYYDTGTFEHLLHVQAVEVCRPQVNVLSGEIGRALKPDGRGYDTSGLRARPTVVTPTDDRGDYLYQHKGRYSYSPKNGNVYPLRPTMDCRWNAEVYWMETDEMEVQWPFEVDHYECDWPSDTTVFVRGDVNGDSGRPIYVPSDYTPTLMSYQEPEGHMHAPTADGTLTAVGEGYSLLRLTTEDDVWFVPIHSVLRSNTDYFSLEPIDVPVGRELKLKLSSEALAGVQGVFAPMCDPTSPGSIYEATSARIWNPNLYVPAQPETSDTGTVDPTTLAESGGDTNTYESVIYPVTANADDPKIEVWWNTTIQQEDMPSPITIPTLPQVYSVHWPKTWEAPQIAIASQLGSAGKSCYPHYGGLKLDTVWSSANLLPRAYFSSEGGTVMFWAKVEAPPVMPTWGASLLSLRHDQGGVTIGVLPEFEETDRYAIRSIYVMSDSDDDSSFRCEIPLPPDADREEYGGWFPIALTVRPDSLTLYVGWSGTGVTFHDEGFSSGLGQTLRATLGTSDQGEACDGMAVGELLFWAQPLAFHAPDGGMDIASAVTRPQDSGTPNLTGYYSFRSNDQVQMGELWYGSAMLTTFKERVMDVTCNAEGCSLVDIGPPLIDTAVIDADSTPRVYVQNEAGADGYNPNEEHAIVRAGSGGYVAWALRTDLNRDDSSAPGVLVEYEKDGRKAMTWFGVAVTNSTYPELAADCVAGKALPGPHPLDFFDDPWRPETYWDEPVATTPAHRDRKGQLWAKAAGDLHVHMYYPMQEGFAFPSVAPEYWPAVGTSIPWLSLLPNPNLDPFTSQPVAWLWRVAWPETVPEIEIGRTLTVAASGLPEVWNAKSMGVVWPATDAARKATAVLFDPTVAQTSGFSQYATVQEAVAALGIKQGAGGNATLRKGKWMFDGLPPSISSRFYLDTTADVTNCLKLVGQQEDNAGGVSLLHVNVLNATERDALWRLLDGTASDAGRNAWHAAIDALAQKTYKDPNRRTVRNAREEVVEYGPRDHYALFTMGATNYVTLIENDSANEIMNVAPGDPIQMHVIKVVPRYYVGRVVTREDPLNLLSQQLSVIYAEAFAGSPENYVFEWKKCAPRPDGVVPTDFERDYTAKFEPTAGLTRFVIGGQGDTLANMVNTYYAVRYRAANEQSPAYATMGYNWSEWTDPPALAEGWVQRVLNNVTPFTQRMRDLVENEAETAVSMIRQAGAPYEGDVALNQDNLTEVGLIQLYETVLNKAESMSLQLQVNDAAANKQLQLAVARLADLYNLLGDEAYTDALNPTIGFGSSQVDYGALSSSLFCFDNQVPTLLDEEIALLRGRTQEMAPSTHISPYYNRLVWNFTRGMNAGEVAYAVNYDISGNGSSVIDYSQAAEMYPQGHGDAYGHYLSALSGYYRLMRNPYFSWGAPAMGEMVVADAVVNVDYYDEAQFAKAAYNVAKTALEVVDRTARKAYRDNGGASGAGYIDSDASRNFGYGEWASRGGFGAFCNWAAGNSLLDDAPSADDYFRHAFTNAQDCIASAVAYYSSTSHYYRTSLETNGTWTLEFQVVSGANAAPGGHANLMDLGNAQGAFAVWLDGSGVLSVTRTSRVAGQDPVSASATFGQIPSGESVLVAIRCAGGKPAVSAFDAAGAKIGEVELPFDAGLAAESITFGGGFIGEIGEFRVWDGVRRDDATLLAKRAFVSPRAEGLSLYLRTISKDGGAVQLADEVDAHTAWHLTGGEWVAAAASGMNIAFTDDGLKRIDRSTVSELVSLAGVADQIQKKVDQMDAGLNPLGLSSGAIPFDLTPIGLDDGTATHFEQIRARAGTALANARAALDKAQESSNRMRMIQDAAVAQDQALETQELEFKNRLIEYFGYPYAGDIGPSGTYPQGYDGPDIYHYAWMDPADFGLGTVSNVFNVSLKVKKDPWRWGSYLYAPADPRNEDEDDKIELTFELSANGMVLKPKSVTGKRLAQGKIQDALASFFVAYAELENAIEGYNDSYEDFETAIAHTRAVTSIIALQNTIELATIAFESGVAAKKCALNIFIDSVEAIGGVEEGVATKIKEGVPKVMGAGMTVNTDPSAIAAVTINGAAVGDEITRKLAILNAKNALSGMDALEVYATLPRNTIGIIKDITESQMDEGEKLRAAVSALGTAKDAVVSAHRNLQIAQAAVETVVAEAQRVIDERTLVRQQAVDSITQARYNEMFFRIQRDNALTRYSSMFDLAQKYAYLTAQAYDYETGLLSSDHASGETFISRIVGVRTLGEFDGDGNPMVATGAAKGDGGLADILAQMDVNWLVLKPRLGINNPQPYATWFSLRHDLFRIFDGAAGDAAWKTELRKYLVDDLNAVPEFRRYCQPLSGSTAAKEPGLVIPFSSAIAHGYNFFGLPLTSGDSALDSTYYATHIASAGVHFENYDRSVFASTPVAYLVPVGEDRMRTVGDPDTVLSWRVVDQTIPAPYAVGSTKLDDPDWAPLFDGNTGGNDIGARIRKHPSFRAYYGEKGEYPSNDSLDCTRLVGRSAWNTKWLLIIPAGSMNADREAALAAFIGGVDQNRDGTLDYTGVSDIKIGLRTYSTSGN